MNTHVNQLQKQSKKSVANAQTTQEKSQTNTTGGSQFEDNRGQVVALKTLQSIPAKSEAIQKMNPLEQEMLEKEVAIDTEKQTLGAKVSGFFGDPSRYTQFVKKAKEFNDEKDDLDKKRELMGELKEIGVGWQKAHQDAKGAKDENEKLKWETVEKFINSTRSNFNEIKEAHNKVTDGFSKFKKAPIKEAPGFHEIAVNWRERENLIERYNFMYAPDKNPMYPDEKVDIDKWRKEAPLESGALEDLGGKVEMKGFLVEGKGNYNLPESEVNFIGTLGAKDLGILSDFGGVEGVINIQASSTRDEKPIHFRSVDGTLEGAEGLLSGLDFLSKDFGISGEIPILVPGINAFVGASLKTNAPKLSEKPKLVANYSKESGLTVTGGAKAEASVAGSLNAGIAAGLPILAQVRAFLEGTLAAILEGTAQFRTRILDGKVDQGADKNALKLDLNGKLKAILELVADAKVLYFFKKEIRKKLAEKELASFEASNHKDPKLTATSIVTGGPALFGNQKDELKEQVSSGQPEAQQALREEADKDEKQFVEEASISEKDANERAKKNKKWWQFWKKK